MNDKTFHPGQRVILPNGFIGVITKEFPIGEFEILATDKAGKLLKYYFYPESIKPVEEVVENG